MLHLIQLLLLVVALVAFVLVAIDSRWDALRVIAFGWAAVALFLLLDITA